MSCVLTLALDDEAQHRFESLRQRHFLPARNRIPAHLTLFHTLPKTAETLARLREISALQQVFSLDMKAPKSIGRGVAYFFESAAAVALHHRLSAVFAEDLSAQDRQGFRPHVVVQNKVTGDVSKATLALLLEGFEPSPVRAVGLDLWRYLDGPWEHMQRFAFIGENAGERNVVGGAGL